ncbi:MAG: PD-(D/E)XK nuclease family protein [Nanoarchaeota archaeon]|nr:PD-(D/E)XK nuclease family protein [Nanoarchaeota archaeon]MBU0963060.1 PD-(D/E)XK nuclease family protein [Nanoarchaeota archaeon]
MEYKLSPSSLGLMKECPRCFWLDKHKVWKRPSGIFPSLPSGMDRILKVHFDRFMKKNELPPELRKSECRDNCNLFEDEEKLKIWRNNLKGIQYKDEEGNILFGAVDNILVKGEKLIVLDYKTRGYDLKEDTADHYQNQLDIYNYLLRKNGYQTEDYAFLLFYVPKEVLETGEIIFDAHLVKRKIDVKNAEKIFKNAVELLNKECPEKSCEWCEGR